VTLRIRCGQGTYIRSIARDVGEAVLWHGGEARSSRDAFARMSQSERRALLRFLESL
jgi:CxxC motif-containing protein (DUF1111 family)